MKGAESKYRVAELLYKKDRTAEAEKIITEFIDQKSPHQYWMARVFLLLADISIKKGDSLQARATLQGLKDNYSIDNDGILDEVKAKLNSLDEVKPKLIKNDKVARQCATIIIKLIRNRFDMIKRNLIIPVLIIFSLFPLNAQVKKQDTGLKKRGYIV